MPDRFTRDSFRIADKSFRIYDSKTEWSADVDYDDVPHDEVERVTDSILAVLNDNAEAIHA